MRERRVAGAARAMRAASLLLLGILLGSAGSRMVRASGPEGACAAVPVPMLEEPARVLPPEWRWTPPGVSVEHVFGRRRSG